MSAMANRLDFSNLIDFVRPVKEPNSGEAFSTKHPPSQTAISGEEARFFYEELCASEKSFSTATTSTTGEQKSGRGQKRRHKKSKDEVIELESFEDSIHDSAGLTASYNKPSFRRKTGQTGRRIKASNSSSRSEEQKVSRRVLEHKQSEFLRCAQNGDLHAMKNLLEYGVNVNFQDIYGWTAAMSAAFEGHIQMLQCLVCAGADFEICNAQGQTALSLAKLKGHMDTVQFLESFQHKMSDAVDKRQTTTMRQNLSFYCEVCKAEFKDTDQKVHLRSTLHLFNTGKKPDEHNFLIPSSNVGYQLMLKSGWDTQKGLGPSGQGHKFPVKTYLKNDRKGLGNEIQEKAKVTHFKPNDHSAVVGQGTTFSKERVANVRTLSRRAQKVKEKRDRQWEIRMRHILS